MITSQILKSFGYMPFVASGGKEAIEIFRERHSEIALVLTDVMMPGMDSIATIRELKMIDPKVLIIAASGLAPDPNSVDASAFLSKPYTAETLLKTIQKCLKLRS